MSKKTKMLWTIIEHIFESRISAGATEKSYLVHRNLAQTFPHGSHGMESHAKKCVERCCELANKTTQQLHEVATTCLDNHQFEEEEMESVGELSTVCSQFVLKCL